MKATYFILPLAALSLVSCDCKDCGSEGCKTQEESKTTAAATHTEESHGEGCSCSAHSMSDEEKQDAIQAAEKALDAIPNAQ